MGSMIPSVSTNSGGDATNQVMKPATCSGARICVAGGGLVWLALLALLGREGTPAGGHRARIQHDRPDPVLLPFVSQRFGKAREAELGGAVGRGVRPTLLSRH